MTPTRKRIAAILAGRYQLEPGRIGAALSDGHLGELDLDSLSLLSFVVELEREFCLALDELRAIARRDCPLPLLVELCHSAAARSGILPALA